MKKLIYSSLIAVLLLAFNAVSFAKLKQQSLIKGTEMAEFYSHLAKGISYPQKAKQANVHGNSIILFEVVDGKLENLKVETELGNGCDTEVLNNILSFTNFKSIKSGKYALKTTFKLDGSHSVVINDRVEASPGYTELKMTIAAVAPETTYKTSKVTVKTTEPLIILDGKTITEGLNSIAPETIESLTVLKDFSAISKYGEEGRNGVLIITSKKATDKITESDKLIIDNAGASVKQSKQHANFKEALVVLNGKITQNVFNTINPETVESLQVLNGLSATSLYGEEGRNGALIITTKKTSDKIESSSTIEIDKTPIDIKRNKQPINFNETLIILDDERTNNDLNSISPETIQSITLLKDFSAISKYGDEGKNGVMIITTKKVNDKKEPIQKPKQ